MWREFSLFLELSTIGLHTCNLKRYKSNASLPLRWKPGFSCHLKKGGESCIVGGLSFRSLLVNTNINVKTKLGRGFFSSYVKPAVQGNDRHANQQIKHELSHQSSLLSMLQAGCLPLFSHSTACMNVNVYMHLFVPVVICKVQNCSRERGRAGIFLGDITETWPISSMHS